MRKRIRCFSNFPLGQYPDAKIPWEDVYLRWKGKPGRKRYYSGPCLECKAEVLQDLKMHEDIRNRPDTGEVNELDPILRPARVATWEERQTWYREDDALYARVLQELETQEFAHYGNDERGALTIVTSAKGIDKREAERMLAWYLEKVHGIRNPKFCWTRPKFVITPVGFGSYE